MASKKLNKKVSSLKMMGDIQREEEIQQYGKLVSLRPSIAHNTKKVYDRKKIKKSNFFDN